MSEFIVGMLTEFKLFRPHCLGPIKLCYSNPQYLCLNETPTDSTINLSQKV